MELDVLLETLVNTFCVTVHQCRLGSYSCFAVRTLEHAAVSLPE